MAKYIDDHFGVEKKLFYVSTFLDEPVNLQPLFAAWALSAREKVKKFIDKGFVGPRQILPHLNYQVEFFETQSELEFLNINTEQDLKTAQYLTTYPQ